jgi:hypothetical protein
VTGRRVPGCWLCDGDPEPPGVPHDAITWYLIALHQLLGHEKAEVCVVGRATRRPTRRVAVTVTPRGEYL